MDPSAATASRNLFKRLLRRIPMSYETENLSDFLIEISENADYRDEFVRDPDKVLASKGFSKDLQVAIKNGEIEALRRIVPTMLLAVIKEP